VVARVELEPVDHGLVRQTAWATAFVAVLLALATWRADVVVEAIDANRGGPLAAAALAVPALFLSVQARAPEHVRVARALFVPRALNVVSALVLYTSAVMLILDGAGLAPVSVVLAVGCAVEVLVAGVALTLLRNVSEQPPTVATTDE
jgi:hypothetical protein